MRQQPLVCLTKSASSLMTPLLLALNPQPFFLFSSLLTCRYNIIHASSQIKTCASHLLVLHSIYKMAHAVRNNRQEQKQQHFVPAATLVTIIKLTLSSLTPHPTFHGELSLAAVQRWEPKSFEQRCVAFPKL